MYYDLIERMKLREQLDLSRNRISLMRKRRESLLHNRKITASLLHEASERNTT
jgi:hypothetical protein